MLNNLLGLKRTKEKFKVCPISKHLFHLMEMKLCVSQNVLAISRAKQRYCTNIVPVIDLGPSKLFHNSSNDNFYFNLWSSSS